MNEMNERKERKKRKAQKRKGRQGACFLLTMSIMLLPQAAFAEGGDPLAVVNNLSDFIFALIRAIGIILLGLGIMQVGLSLKSHDPSQRANGFLTLAGGVVITFTEVTTFFNVSATFCVYGISHPPL